MIQVQAHRGASGYAPENTLASFQMAVDMKADGIECDIHLSKDGVFVVCHDETIDRTSDGTGRIADMTYEEIAKHNFSGKFIRTTSTAMPRPRRLCSRCSTSSRT